MSDGDLYRTNDMGMVSYLRLHGHPVQRCEWSEDINGSCYWFFIPTEGLLSLSADFIDGRALVEPKEFSKNYSITKREFHSADRARGSWAARSQPT